jgi:hypothetical protein
MRCHQPIEHVPWHVLQDGVEYAIVMPHGVDLLPCPETLPDVRKTEESTPCALSTKTQPDSRGLDPRIHLKKLSYLRKMDCRVKPGNDDAESSKA